MGDTCNLTFSPGKTVAMIFHKSGRLIARPKKIDGRKLQYVTQMRYLGVIIDHRLSWKPHINKALDTGCTLTQALASKTRGLYGPKPK